MRRTAVLSVADRLADEYFLLSSASGIVAADATKARHFFLRLDRNAEFRIDGGTSGAWIVLRVEQAGTGSYTLTANPSMSFKNGETTLPLLTAVGSVTYLAFRYEELSVSWEVTGPLDRARADGLYDPAGTAAAAVAAHEAASDPHPQYLTQAEGDARYDLLGAGAGAITGSIILWPTTTAPTGWLLCDGAAVSRVTYATLFALIATTFGAGDGITTFNVPNLKSRVPVGLDSGDTDFDAMGETGGAKTVASAGTNSAPTFAGAALAGHSHGAGTYAVADHAAHTHDVTSNVSVNDHASHTHSVTSNVSVDNHASHTHTYTDVVNHKHTFSTMFRTATTGADTTQIAVTADTSSTKDVTNFSDNPSGGVATGTTAGPSATLTHTTNNPAVTSAGPSATLTHTVNNPAVTSGNPSATLSHTFSGSSASVSAGTPAGTVSAPVYTGSTTSVVQPYIVLNYIVKT